LDLELFVTVVFDALAQSGIGVALVLANFVVVGVVAVAVFADGFAHLFLEGHLHLSVGVDEIHHVDNILGLTVGAGLARVGRAKGEFDQVLGVQDALFVICLLGNLHERGARGVLDGVVHHPCVISVSVLIKGTSLRHKLLASSGLGGDVAIGDEGFGANTGSKSSENS
jgi:hypothetical protein